MINIWSDVFYTEGGARLADLPWKLLNCLMRHQDIKVEYDRIYIEVWGDPYHDSGDVATVMHRLRQYFKKIDVDDEDLKDVFQTFRGDGLLFAPRKTTELPPDDFDNKLRNIGMWYYNIPVLIPFHTTQGTMGVPLGYGAGLDQSEIQRGRPFVVRDPGRSIPPDRIGCAGTNWNGNIKQGQPRPASCRERGYPFLH